MQLGPVRYPLSGDPLDVSIEPSQSLLREHLSLGMHSLNIAPRALRESSP
jgi:hypothetical protein